MKEASPTEAGFRAFALLKEDLVRQPIVNVMGREEVRSSVVASLRSSFKVDRPTRPEPPTMRTLRECERSSESKNRMKNSIAERVC